MKRDMAQLSLPLTMWLKSFTLQKLNNIKSAKFASNCLQIIHLYTASSFKSYNVFDQTSSANDEPQ